MTDLKERFGLADRIDAPNLWAEARRRSLAPVGAMPSRSVAPRLTWERIGTVAVAFAIFAAAAVFAWNVATPQRMPRPAPAVDLSAELRAGWNELPPPPENRSNAATAWTGSELLIWGGYEYVGSNEDPEADGFSFDATTRRWEMLPASPLDGRSDAAHAWTGSELLIWGGWDGGFREPPYFDDGAAYDPVARTWRTLPPAPLGARSPFAAWTGEELIVWGSTDRSDRMRDGAAYDPVSDTWRRIAEAPADITDGSAVWTGEEMIVLGAALDSYNHADTPTAIGVAYEPVTDTWRELPPSELSPQAMTASWLRGELIAWDYDHATAAYDPTTDEWRSLRRVPLEFSECRPVSVATSRTVFGEFCGQTVVFSPEDRAWHRDPMPAAEPEGGCCDVVEPILAGDVVLVGSHWYGKALQAMDRRMFAYNPPAVVRTDDRGEVVEPEPFFPATQRDGDDLRMPVVFPDGTRTTLVYPIPLGLEQLGVQPNVSYLWEAYPPPRFPIVFLYDPNASIATYVDGTEPVMTTFGVAEVELWEMSEEWQRNRRLPQGHWLRYSTRTWTVLVAVERLDRADEVADGIAIVETDHGPVVRTSGPIALSNESGEGEGPMLQIGSVGDTAVLLWLERCSFEGGVDEVLQSGAYGSACLADGLVTASIYGSPSTVEAIAEGLRIEDLEAG